MFLKLGLPHKKIGFFIILNALLILQSCSSSQCANNSAPKTQKIKNVILMIGDGMGPQQIAQAIQYQQFIKTNQPALELENLFSKADVFITSTSSTSGPVTDSAAAATAIACGIKTKNNIVGLDDQGIPCKTIADLAKEKGMKVGLVSNTRLSHATPAGFSAHNIFRENENDIAKQIIDEAQIDLLLNGGGKFLLPQTTADGTKRLLSAEKECAQLNSQIDGQGARTDNLDLIQLAKSKGYHFVCKQEDLLKVTSLEKQKLLGVFSNSIFPFVPERKKIESVPSTATMTKQALELLSQSDQGFFLMIEGGLIDFAAHYNDPGSMLQETLDFDATIAVAQEFVDKHPDTLFIVTADHETGGYGLSYRRYQPNEKTVQEILNNQNYKASYSYPTNDALMQLGQQNASYYAMIHEVQNSSSEISDQAHLLHDMLMKNLNMTADHKELVHVLSAPHTEREQQDSNLPFCSNDNESFHINQLSRILAPKTFSTWSTGNHTATPVFSFFQGLKSPTQSKIIQNTDIYHFMEQALLNQP